MRLPIDITAVLSLTYPTKLTKNVHEFILFLRMPPPWSIKRLLYWTVGPVAAAAAWFKYEKTTMLCIFGKSFLMNIYIMILHTPYKIWSESSEGSASSSGWKQSFTNMHCGNFPFFIKLQLRKCQISMIFFPSCILNSGVSRSPLRSPPSRLDFLCRKRRGEGLHHLLSTLAKMKIMMTKNILDKF